MEIELKIHKEPWSGSYLRVVVRLPDGTEAEADLSLTELRRAIADA